MFPSLSSPSRPMFVVVVHCLRFFSTGLHKYTTQCMDRAIAPVSKRYEVIMISALSSETICLFACKASTPVLFLADRGTSAPVEDCVNSLDNGVCNSTRHPVAPEHTVYFSRQTVAPDSMRTASRMAPHFLLRIAAPHEHRPNPAKSPSLSSHSDWTRSAAFCFFHPP